MPLSRQGDQPETARPDPRGTETTTNTTIAMTTEYSTVRKRYGNLTIMIEIKKANSRMTFA